MGARDSAGTFSKEFLPGLETVMNAIAFCSVYYIHNVYNSLTWVFFLVRGTLLVAD
jgi:hypothetical protein